MSRVWAKKRGSRILAIGDTHFGPDYDSKRMKVAGQFAAWFRPDVVVQVGDIGDMASLNSHRSKIEAEMNRICHDTEAIRDGIGDFMRPLYSAKKTLPRFILTEGNHCNYYRRLIDQDPRLEGSLDFRRDFGLDQFGWESYPYQDRVHVDGFHFCHNIATKSSIAADVGSPKWGFVRKGISMVCGHTHTFVHMRHPMLWPDGSTRRIHGVNLGCFIHKDMGHQEHWSRSTSYTYDRGLTTFENAVNGDAKITFWRAESDLGV